MSLDVRTDPKGEAQNPYAPAPAAPPAGRPILDQLEGREINRAAILSILFGVLSLVGLYYPPLLIVCVIGIACAAIAYYQISNGDGDGYLPAHVGLGLSGLILVGGITWNAIDYATEVPEGARRISFFDLQPTEFDTIGAVPPTALALSGQRIFIKGYVFPDGQADNIKEFILVPDQGTCCFGGDPAPTDVIVVKLRDPLRTHYSWNMRKLAGVLKVSPELRPRPGIRGIYYQLDADYVR